MALVAVTDHVFPDLEQERRLLPDAGHELRFGSNAASVEEVRDAVAGADAVLNCYAQMPAEVIRGLDRCVVIARYGIGLDTIDLDAGDRAGHPRHERAGLLHRRGVRPRPGPDPVARARRDAARPAACGSGSWTPTDARPLHRLRGRTLGLVGFGRIARALAAQDAARSASGSSTTDPFVPDDAVREAGAEPLSLEELLAAADVVSIHAPLTADSRHLIGAAELATMKPGAILVNTSRGPLVDLDALRAALGGGSARRGRPRRARGGAARARGPAPASRRRRSSRRTPRSTARSRCASSSARPSSR